MAPLLDRPPKTGWDLEEGAPIAPGRSVLKQLGGGTRYEVYLVWDDRLFSIMVAKLLRPNRVRDGHAQRALEREARMLESLAHPVVLRGFGAVLEPPMPHLLVEHLEGPTLRRLIKRGGPLPMQQLLPLALHMASAIHYLSTEGVAHLDIKPANIVMGIPPRLIDLSIARSYEEAARIEGAIGTDAYMAPEQCGPGSAGAIGPGTDVWGLGATLYHAASGQVPFPRGDGAGESPDPAVRFPQLTADPQPLPGGVPVPLSRLILRMLRRDPGDRPAAAEAAAELERLVDTLPRKMKISRRGPR